MPFSQTSKAFAKINLFLNLLGKRPDGFHEVRFIMQTLSLADTLEVTHTGEGLGIDFTCSDPTLANTDNLIVKAYHHFYQSTKLPPLALQVNLQKEIPIQAGLGGGSSDAAAMLKTLNTLHQEALSSHELHALAAHLGSDVPFFLTGGTCLATGRGEIVTPLPSLPSQKVVLLKPKGYGISTPYAYQLVQQKGYYQTHDISPFEAYLKLQTPYPETLGALLLNDFESALFEAHPDLAKTKETLLGLGLPGALLSGSGPTLFGILSNPEPQMAAIKYHFSADQWVVLETQALDFS